MSMESREASIKQQVEIVYLEMTTPEQLRGKHVDIEGLAIKQVETPLPELNRFLYMAVGERWLWVDKLPWSSSDWMQWVNRPGFETWVAYVHGSPAGYYELDLQEKGNIELAYFGLLNRFIGIGLGGRLLTHAIERAWKKGAQRIWVHTCSLDHPAALPNYLARGFTIFDRKVIPEELPDGPLIAQVYPSTP